MAKVTADSRGEPVAANTSTESATMRSASAAIAIDRLANRTRKAGTAKTSR